MTTNNNKSSHTSIPVKCGDCMHFCKEGHVAFGKRCKDLGVEAFASACSKYTPDYSLLVSKDALESIHDLAKIARNFNDKQLRIMSFMFKNMSKIFKTAFKFGQPVFFNLSAPSVEYLECYYSGYVVGASADGEHLHIASSLDNLNGTYLMLLTKSVMPKSVFTKHRIKLEAQGHVDLPDNMKHHLVRSLPNANRTPLTLIDDVPTIDTVDPSWYTKIGATVNKRRKSKKSYEDEGTTTTSVKKRSRKDMPLETFTIQW